MAKQDPDGKKLDEELDSIGYPGGQRGDAKNRADLFGTTPGVVRQWITGRFKTPNWPWIIIKLYSMLDADQRVAFRRWVRNRFEKKS